MADKHLVPAGNMSVATIVLPDPQEIAAILADNFGDADGLDAFSLARVKVPSGGGIAWAVPTENGPEPRKTISGVILAHKTWRAYWPGKFGDGDASSPPDCSSRNGRIGEGEPGGSCKACPLNQWGSADVEDEENNGKACKEVRAVFLLQDGDMLPTLLLLPPMSIKPFTEYMMLVTTKMKRSFWHIRTEFALATDKNSSGINYSKAIPSFAGVLADGDVETVRAIKESVMPLLDDMEVYVERGDVDGAVDAA